MKCLTYIVLDHKGCINWLNNSKSMNLKLANVSNDVTASTTDIQLLKDGIATFGVESEENVLHREKKCKSSMCRTSC